MFKIITFILAILLKASLDIKPSCRERYRPITTESGDLYTLVDATLNQKLVLQCHYCNENGDIQPRNWYKIDKLGLGERHEVQLSMENEMELNRISVNTEHSLIINNFSDSDTGLYYCLGLDQEPETEEKYNYLVELVYDANITDVESGNISAWLKYHDENFSPINKLFAESQGVEFVYLRDQLKLNMELISQWDPWGTCDACGRPNGEGSRQKRGHCRIKMTKNGRSSNTSKPDDMFFLAADKVSCRSIRLGRVFPGISNLTKVLPDFVQTERCEGVCNPDAEGVNRGWKVGKSGAFKYRKTFVLAEKSHLTLVCPEYTLENSVTWKKMGKILKPGDVSNPNVIVDLFGTLYLVEVTDNEAGNYTCQVDDIKMQQIRIFVVSKSKILTGEFVRHLMYLGFILFLTSSCYCAGLIITFNRRKLFKNYEELLEEHPEDEELQNLI